MDPFLPQYVLVIVQKLYPRTFISKIGLVLKMHMVHGYWVIVGANKIHYNYRRIIYASGRHSGNFLIIGMW